MCIRDSACGRRHIVAAIAEHHGSDLFSLTHVAEASGIGGGYLDFRIGIPCSGHVAILETVLNHAADAADKADLVGDVYKRQA